MSQPLQLLANSLIIFTIVLTTASHGTDAASDIQHNDTHEAHGVSVVHLQFEYVEQPLILTIFLIFVVLIKIGGSSACLLHGYSTVIFTDRFSCLAWS